jgi:hypothetical protein
MAAVIFKIGELYSNARIGAVLQVGNAGGIRVSRKKGKATERIVLFSTHGDVVNPKESPYFDRGDSESVVYTGTGRFGDMALSGPNLLITKQKEEGFPIYVFELAFHRKARGSTANRWRFRGVFVCESYHREPQEDLLGNPRSAWAFELKRLPVAEASPEREGEIRKLVLTARPSKSNPLGKILPPAYSSGEVIEALGKMSAMSPRDFEYFIRDALLASDFREVRVTRQSADEGIDVVAKFPESIWTFPKQTIQIQAKRWKNSVGRKVVTEFRGSLSPRAVGAILTTSHFAQTAIREAERPNSLPVSLVDGHHLAFAALRLGLLK